MNYFYATAKDQRPMNWILYSSTYEGGCVIRSLYRHLVCENVKCLIDRYAAIKLGIEASVIIKSCNDYFLTEDGFVMASTNLKNLLNENGVEGVEFHAVPSSSDFWVMMPTIFIPVDLPQSGMRVIMPCRICGRYREVVGFPLKKSLDIPVRPLALMCLPPPIGRFE